MVDWVLAMDEPAVFFQFFNAMTEHSAHPRLYYHAITLGTGSIPFSITITGKLRRDYESVQDGQRLSVHIDGLSRSMFAPFTHLSFIPLHSALGLVHARAYSGDATALDEVNPHIRTCLSSVNE